MLKRLKSVSMMLFLMGASTGAAYAVTNPGVTDVKITQQSGTCTGVVKDATGETVIGASVVVKGTTNGTITDFDGNFTLGDVKKGDVIQISFVGYKTQEVKYTGQPLNIILQDDTEVLDEVVVVGYGGSQKRATLTTAVSKMDNQVLEKAAYSNVGQSLQGSVSGLRVINNSGQPGSSPNIVLRGGASITGTYNEGNNDALIVVDGIVRESMAGINPSDIESIQVLKDAASTAIYGSRANGGVILIETKSGKEGKATVTYKFKLGINYARKGYEYVGAEDYLYYNRLGFKRYNSAMAGHGNGVDPDGQQGIGTNNSLYDVRYLEGHEDLVNQGWQTMTDPYTGKQLVFKDYHGAMEDEVFNNSAMTQDHYIDFTGGNDKATFVASLGYYNEDGQIRGTGFKRFTGNINGSYKILPILTVKAGASYVYSEQPSLSWTVGLYEFFYRTRGMRPTWNPWNEDGTPASGLSTSDGNPLYWRDKMLNSNGTRRSTYNIGFTLDILPKKLVLNGNASLYHYDYQQEKFNKAYQAQTDASPNTTREGYVKMNRSTQRQINTTLTYTDTFAEKHNLEAMIGGEYFYYNSFELEAKAEGAPTDDIPTLNVSSKYTKTTTSKTGYRILSGFGRVNYNYNMKYLLSVVARYDGISRLDNNRWGFFPGISAGWNIMEEDFWKDSKISEIVSNLKPRVSYGVNGNVNGLKDFAVYGVYGTTDQKYGGQTGIYNSGLINSDLRWEQSQTFEFGLDFGFLRNRLNFIFDFYSRTTKDLLTSLDLPSYTGFSSLTTNLGTLRNSGVELEVRANLIEPKKDGISWNMTANITTVSNKILKLPKNANNKNRVGGYEAWDPSNPTQKIWLGGRQEGGKIGEIIAYKQQHIFKDWDDVKQHANNRIDNIANLYGPGMANVTPKDSKVPYSQMQGWKPIEPGDVCWEDINGDDQIDVYDRRIIGNIFPNVTGGFSSTWGYKGFKLYTRFDYALGHTLYNDLAARTLGQYQGTWGLIDKVHDMWSEENTGSDLPKFYFADQLAKKNITRSNNAGMAINNNSSRFYQKGDYLCMREITLSYQLPHSLTSKCFIQDASVYVTGQNLFYITGYDGTSPEPAVSGSYPSGIDCGRYPTPRTLLFGLSLTF